MIESLPTGLTRYEMTQLFFPDAKPVNEYGPFHDTDILGMHNHNEKGRMRTRLALQQAVTPLVAKVIAGEHREGRVLEVGCGTGYFSQYLAPSWLKPMLVSFDINNYALPEYQRRDSSAKLFQGNIYDLGVRPNSFDAVIGLSAFDSFMFLDKAIEEATAVLRPGGFMILLQDVIPVLWAEEGVPLSARAVETYHSRLVEVIENQRRLALIEGREGYLEGAAVRPFVPALDYRDDQNSTQERRSLAHLSNLGEAMLIMRSESKFFPEWDDRGALKYFSRKFKTQERLDKVALRRDQVIEWARLRYVVAQKNA